MGSLSFLSALPERAELFGTASFLISAIAYWPYWRSILYKGVRPSKAAWIVFALVDGIIFFAMLAQGVFAGMMLAYFIGATSIAIYAVFKGTPGWSVLDRWVLGLSGAAMALWFVVSPNAAIALSLIAISIGSIPLWMSCWRNPRSEDWLPWFLYWVSGLCGVLAISEWTLASALGPVGYWVLQTLMVALTVPAFRRSPVRWFAR